VTRAETLRALEDFTAHARPHFTRGKPAGLRNRRGKLGKLRSRETIGSTAQCSGCAFDVTRKSGPGACPFNYLYWAFLIRQKDRLAANPRLAMPYRTLDR